jgi:hypothetical protein
VALTIGAASGIIAIWATLAGTDLGDLDTALAANQDDLICGLFSAASADGAKTAFLDVLDGVSVSNALQALVGFMLSFRTLNELFVQTGTYVEGDDYLNDDYQATDCNECTVDCHEFLMLAGVDNGDGTFDSVLADAAAGTHAISFYTNVDDALQICGDPPGLFRLTGVADHTNYTGSGANSQNFRIASAHTGLGEGCSGWDLYCSDDQPSSAPIADVRAINFRSNTAFSITIISSF